MPAHLNMKVTNSLISMCSYLQCLSVLSCDCEAALSLHTVVGCSISAPSVNIPHVRYWAEWMLLVSWPWYCIINSYNQMCILYSPRALWLHQHCLTCKFRSQLSCASECIILKLSAAFDTVNHRLLTDVIKNSLHETGRALRKSSSLSERSLIVKVEALWPCPGDEKIIWNSSALLLQVLKVIIRKFPSVPVAPGSDN